MSLKNLAKGAVPPVVWSAIKGASNVLWRGGDRTAFFVARKGRRIARRLGIEHRRAAGAGFAMLCIRRPVYVGLAIDSINSLHYHNRNNHVLLHVDETCRKTFLALQRKVDYPGRIELVEAEDDISLPWTVTKLRVLLDAAAKGVAFVDADSRWHADPARLIDGQHPMFLVAVNRFKDVEPEKLLVETALGREAWADWQHYNTAFFHLPRALWSEELRTCAEGIYRRINSPDCAAVLGASAFLVYKRVSEEIALSLAVQCLFRETGITTLKKKDGLGDREILESYYYGAINHIL